MDSMISTFSKTQLVIVYQCCVLTALATTRLYVIAHFTVEPRLSGFLDYPDFFSGPNLVMIISHDQDS